MSRALGIEPGDELSAWLDGQRIVLEPRSELLRGIQGELRGVRGERSLVEELIAERRRETPPERSG